MIMDKRINVWFGGLLLAGLLHAQFENAEVLGTVHDQSGGTLTKASVTLTNQETGIKAQSVTDENGSFDFFNVKVGRYTLTVEHAGFSKAAIPDLTVDVGARRRADVAMQVGAVTASIEVSAVAAALETDSSEHGQVIDTAAVTELPLNGRNYADLALLSTNAVKSPISATFSPSGTPREGAFNVNGMRSTYNNFLLDGLDNNAYGTSNQGYSAQLVQLSPDALAEFKVITSNYSGRRRGERRDEIRDQRVSRLGLRVPAQHSAQRHRLPVQPRRLREAHLAAQPVRGHHRRTTCQEQAVLLRGLRRLPPAAALP